jgi:hypothetical protein
MDINSERDESDKKRDESSTLDHSLMRLAAGSASEFEKLKELPVRIIYDTIISKWREAGGLTKAEKIRQYMEGKRESPV